jgi:hypothetical protein
MTPTLTTPIQPLVLLVFLPPLWFLGHLPVFLVLPMSIKDAGAFVNDLVRGRGFGNVRAIGRLKDRVVVNPKIANGGASKVAVEQKVLAVSFFKFSHLFF